MPSEAVKADIKINGDKISTPIEGVDATYAFDGVYGADVKTVSLDYYLLTITTLDYTLVEVCMCDYQIDCADYGWQGDFNSL